MIESIDKLQPRLQKVVRDLINRARSEGRVSEQPWGDRLEAYAYPLPGRGIAWGVNAGDGCCMARGVSR